MTNGERNYIRSLQNRSEQDAKEHLEKLNEIGVVEFGLPSNCSLETIIVKAVESHNDEILFDIMNAMELYYNAIGSKNAYDRMVKYEVV